MGIRIEEGGAESPQTVDEARDAVVRSRQRISSTLDELEGRIVDTKQELRERVDVLRPVREQIKQRPWAAVAIAAGVGALLGSLGGGDDEDSIHRRRSGRLSGRTLEDEDRRELQEWRRMRRRRLRAAARHARRDQGEDQWTRSDRFDNDDEGDSRFDALKHQLLGALTSAVTTAVTKRVRRMAMDNVGTVVDSVLGGDGENRNDRESGRLGQPHHDGRGSARGAEMDRDLRYAARER
ncbi:MAG TPA: hypothetical protein VK929_12580 [Longimicrobiales bacterium]|nr:hypothetical protein [Longimicrobiales bacterium]